MREKKPFHTTTAAEFREIAKAARTAGRLAELIQALTDRLERHRAVLQLHESTRNFQAARETKKLMANLENKLEIARELQDKTEVE